MPGPVALRKKQYYGFPGNQFWPIICDLFGERRDLSYKEKKALLRRERVALWDVLKSCYRQGACDSAIRREIPNDLARLLRKYPLVNTIFLNGKGAEKLFRKYFDGRIPLSAHVLPSTSPAHASMAYREKLKRWTMIKKYLVNRNPWC